MAPPLRPLKVAIIGRPNVGKSTLFNRLVGRKIALVDDRPGVTRDRREGTAELGDLLITLIDTAGLEEADPGSLEGRMRAQTERAVDEADVSLFLIDARAGLTPTDRHFADMLRKTGKPVVLVANKCEGAAGDPGFYESFALGFGEPVAFSAEHGLGLADLHEALRAHLPDEQPEDEAAAPEDDGTVRIAVVGRPNAGKSTLVNRLIGEDRMLTGPEAGITRDAIAVDWEWKGRPVRLVDTAGLRRKARVQEKLEKLSVGDALRAIRAAEVVILVVDEQMPFEKQDLQIADLVTREGRALVIAVNKWDRCEEPDTRIRELREMADRLLPQVRGMPLVPVSALTGYGLPKLMQAVFKVRERWERRVPTSELNRWFAALIEHHPPPAVAGRRIKLRYVTQGASRPPTFITFGTRVDALPESYRRYLLNGLREAFDLVGVPVRLYLRKTENPYEKS
ncbi:ribosome biogenesis GTPase Der [Microbaculum marinisediminis]|uniref:GTPase Der n=1 Tax=Microbaculum marinisediminis TaxID=2931392 RepID=A0AAW5R245_9HYPH|nr:ribosome biogenesis GTPase Der [Microbaculum sp. A6E488]MCT8973197.1 ribosome biogenesis GTPase Der [Microbaculum sp. A6E488]